jgi:hypothetical protein
MDDKMKRSEMVNKLAEQFLLRDMVGENMANLAANEILQILEDADMAPPTREWGNYFAKRDWEPEDIK